MEKYDITFTDLENRLVYEARTIPPDMHKIEELLKAGADLNKTGTEKTVFLTILEYYGEYVDETGEVKETGATTLENCLAGSPSNSPSSPSSFTPSSLPSKSTYICSLNNMYNIWEMNGSQEMLVELKPICTALCRGK